MILITGIPDAGKTTYSARYPASKVVHFDEIIGRHRYERVALAVQKDPHLVVEGVYGKASKRAELVKASCVRNTCIWLKTPLDECLKRETEGRNRSGHMVIWANDDYEPVTYAEGWDEIIVIE